VATEIEVLTTCLAVVFGGFLPLSGLAVVFAVTFAVVFGGALFPLSFWVVVFFGGAAVLTPAILNEVVDWAFNKNGASFGGANKTV